MGRERPRRFNSSKERYQKLYIPSLNSINNRINNNTAGKGRRIKNMRNTCNTCGKRKWFVKQRQYNVPIAPNTPPQVITSQGMLCRKCYKNLKKLFKIK